MALMAKKINTDRKELDGLKVVQATYRCYIAKAPVVLASPACEYVLREKKTNKEIVPFQFANRIQGQQVNVMQNPAETAKFHNFLRQMAAHEELGAKLMDRECKDVYVNVNGVFLSEDDTKINLMNPVFTV
jgi:hypothetical protein